MSATFSLSLHFSLFSADTAKSSFTRSISDRIGEAKASGNLGNTLKMMDQYDGATIYCKRHLEISRELNDKVGV